MRAMPESILDMARKAAAHLFHVHQVKSDGAIIGLPVLYPGGEHASVYISADRPGLVFVSDFEGGRKRAMMEGVEEAFDEALAEIAPQLTREGLSIYARVPREELAQAIATVADASTRALCLALERSKRRKKPDGDA